MRARSKETHVTCPCCSKVRALNAGKPPLSQEEVIQQRGLAPWWSNPGWTAQQARSGSLQWACHACIKFRRALEAKPWLQTFCDYPPRLAYYDIEKVCKSCGSRFVFAAGEQQRWYEQLKFWVQAEPTRCPACRRSRRAWSQANQALSAELVDLNPGDARQLARISDLYLAMGSSRKAAEFLSRARNRAGSAEA